MLLKCKKCGFINIAEDSRRARLQKRVLDYLKEKGWVKVPKLKIVLNARDTELWYALDQLLKLGVLKQKFLLGGKERKIKLVKLA